MRLLGELVGVERIDGFLIFSCASSSVRKVWSAGSVFLSMPVDRSWNVGVWVVHHPAVIDESSA
jgi:hypothetical protein